MNFEILFHFASSTNFAKKSQIFGEFFINFYSSDDLEWPVGCAWVLPELGKGYIPPFPDLPMTAVSILVVDLALIRGISDSPASRVH